MEQIDDVQALVDAERLEAAHSEWERHDRVHKVLLLTLECAAKRARLLALRWMGDDDMAALIGELEGVKEILKGDWLHSPRDMRAERGGVST